MSIGDGPLRSTVVITTYGRPKLMLQALESLELQTIPPDEVIVVDDGSPEPVAQPSGPLDTRVVRQGNAGLAAARNRGVAEATGDIVFFLDDDDVYLPKRIEHAVAAHQASDFVVCGQTHFSGVDRPEWLDKDAPAPSLYRRIRRGVRPTSAISARAILHRTTPSFGALSVRAEHYFALDETYRAAQDVDWWMRAAEQDVTVARVPFDDLAVRRHGGVRYLNGIAARLKAQKRMLIEHDVLLNSDDTTLAFRYARLAALSGQLGERRDGLRYALKSLRIRPSYPGLHALGTVVAGKRL